MIIKRQRNFSWEQGENGTWHYSPKGRELKFMYMKDKDVSDNDEIEESEEPTEEEEVYDESEREYSEKDKLRTGDKFGIWIAKHLQTKKDREAMIDAYENGNFHKLGVQSAKYAALGGGIGGALVGGLVGGKKGALVGATGGAAVMPLIKYPTIRLSGFLNKKLKKHSRDVDDRSRRTADRIKVANGDMTVEEYLKKHK